MPELPEVETVRRGLLPHLQGRRIRSVTVRDARLRWPVPADLAKRLRERTVTAIDRRGKYLIVTLDSADRVIVHLGMSGRVLVLAGDTPVRKHDHVDWLLDSGQIIRYHDPRRFGAMLLWAKGETTHVLLDNSYGKVRRVHEAWTADAPRVRWAGSPDEAVAAARALLSA